MTFDVTKVRYVSKVKWNIESVSKETIVGKQCLEFLSSLEVESTDKEVYNSNQFNVLVHTSMALT